MALLIIIGILGVLLTGLLFSPLVLQVDTCKNQYVLRWGLGGLQFIPAPDDLLLRLNIGFWNHSFSLLKLLSRPAKKKNDSTFIPAKQKAKAKRKAWPFQRFMRLIRTFRVLYFRLDLDSDDFAMNAYLYPVFRALSNPTRRLTINFQGHNQCAFMVKNRAINVLVALIF